MARHFTKDEIEEIRVQLATKAVRDSELPAAETVYDNDEVAIVQAGSNKRLSVTTLEEHIREPFASDEQTRQANEVARKKAEGQFGSGDPDYATSRVKKESDRQAAEIVRQEQEEARQRGESDRNMAYATAEGTKSGSTASDGSRWGEYKAAENARNAARLAAEGTIESLADDGTRWGEYKEAEGARDTDRAAQEGSRSSSTKGDGTMWGEYKQAESDRDDAYAVQEGTSSSSAGNSSRWGAYKTAEAARNTARETVEGSSSSTAGDGTRWGAYKTAEANRDTARQTAEGSASSTAGDGSRWGAYKTAEAARDTARQTAEGTSSSTAGDGTRWGAYKTAEDSRGTAYTAAEGTSSASAGDANRWGAYKSAEAARDTAYADQEGTSSSTAGDGTRWGSYKTAEAERSAAMNSKADKDADAVEGNLAKFDGNGNPVDAGYSAMRIHRDLGYNASQTTVVLTAGETGKYVKRSTRSAEVNANFNISAPFNVDACSELLIKTGYNPSDNEHAALDISVIAIYEEMERTRTVQAKDGNNNPLYYEVDEDGNPTSTQTTTVTPYPVYTTETYTEHRYLPNNEDRLVAIPDSGYYVANIPQSCKCVISYKPGVTDLNVIVVKHGALANLTSQIFGIYEHRTMAEAVVSLALRLDALERRIVRPGNIEVGKIDAVDIMRYRQPVVLLATGAPNASLRPTNLPDDIPWDGIPAFIGQFYYAEWKDGANTIRRLYFSTNITAISDWHYVALT